jgi:hypothetical protein
MLANTGLMALFFLSYLPALRRLYFSGIRIQGRIVPFNMRVFTWAAGSVLALTGIVLGIGITRMPLHQILFYLVSIRLLTLGWDRIHLVRSTYSCEICGRVFDNYEDANRHSFLEHENDPRRTRAVGRRIDLNRRIIVPLLIVLLFLALPYFRVISYVRATTFQSLSGFESGSIDTFPEIDPQNLRLNTQGIAASIAQTKKHSGASFITSVNLGMYQGNLAWFCSISETPLFGMLVFGSNRIKEVIIVPLNDATGKFAKVIDLSLEYDEGLWLDRDMLTHANDVFPLRTFTRAYLTQEPSGKIVVVTTSFFSIWTWVDPKVHVWDLNGRFLAEYDPWSTPPWVVQRWDEMFVEAMGDDFGDFRWSDENDLNFFVGIPYQTDRGCNPAEPEGLRYQMWDHKLYGVYLFANKRNPDLLELAILTRESGITVYNLQHLRLISPQEAKNVATTGLPALAEDREYDTPIALIYRIGDSLYYHIPIYVGNILAYFALVRTTDRERIRVDTSVHGGVQGAVMKAYSMAGGRAVGENVIEGKLVDKDEYVVNGNTHYWLTVETDEGRVDILAKAESLTDEIIHKIEDMRIGQKVEILVNMVNGVYELVDVL